MFFMKLSIKYLKFDVTLQNFIQDMRKVIENIKSFANNIQNSFVKF